MASPENGCVVDQSGRGVWCERNQCWRCEHLPSGASEQYHVDDSQICVKFAETTGGANAR